MLLLGDGTRTSRTIRTDVFGVLCVFALPSLAALLASASKYTKHNIYIYTHTCLPQHAATTYAVVWSFICWLVC